MLHHNDTNRPVLFFGKYYQWVWCDSNNGYELEFLGREQAKTYGCCGAIKPGRE